jgi:hypothetical protein
MKKYQVTLTAEARKSLQDMGAAGTAASKKLLHARSLLQADAPAPGPAWIDLPVIPSDSRSLSGTEEQWR